MLKNISVVLSIILLLFSCGNVAVDTEYVTINFDKGRVFYNEVEVEDGEALSIPDYTTMNFTFKIQPEDRAIFDSWVVEYNYSMEMESETFDTEDIKVERETNVYSVTLNLEEYTYEDIRSTTDGTKLSFLSKELNELYIHDLKNSTERTVSIEHMSPENHWWISDKELVLTYQDTYEPRVYNFTYNEWSDYNKDWIENIDDIDGEWNQNLSRFYYISTENMMDYICYYDYVSNHTLTITGTSNIDQEQIHITPDNNIYYLYTDDSGTNHIKYYDESLNSVTTVMETIDNISFHTNSYNNELLYSIDDTDEFYLLKTDLTSDLIYTGTECSEAIRISENRYSFRENIDGYTTFRNITLLDTGVLSVLK